MNDTEWGIRILLRSKLKMKKLNRKEAKKLIVHELFLARAFVVMQKKIHSRPGLR